MSNFAKILEAAKKIKDNTGGSSSNSDEKFWKAETDKSGNGSAIIRFLPGKTDDDLPFTKIYNHGFKGPTGKWFIENCPTTIGDDCPVCAANGELWNSGNEKDKEIVRERKRKLGFIANILVISDPANPDNEGKVFLFKFGKKIFDKITDAMEPDNQGIDEDSDDFVQPINPFDVGSEGANFKLKIRRVEGFANFDKSEFTKAKSMDADWDEVKEQLHDLSVFTAPESFKDYETLEKKLKTILSGVQSPATRSKSAEDDTEIEQHPKFVEAKLKEKQINDSETNSDDDDMEFFKNLAKD